MKKRKLITGLTTLSLGGSVAAVATACTTYPPYMDHTFTITASNVTLGNAGTLINGQTLPNFLQDGEYATFTLNGFVADKANIAWTIKGGDTPIEKGDSYSFFMNGQDLVFKVLKAKNFDPNTKYTITATVEKDSASFSFITKKDGSVSDPTVYVAPVTNTFTAGEEVEKPVKVGVLTLFGPNSRLITTDQTSNLKIDFTADNETGFTKNNIGVSFDPSNGEYTVTIKDGTPTNEKSCVGNISVIWTYEGQPYSSTTYMSVNVLKGKSVKLTKTIYGPDLLPVSGEEPTIPVIQDSGIYLELTDPETQSKVNAKWVVLGGGVYVNLINENDYASMNGLKVNLVPAAEIPATIMVKAIPEDPFFEDAIFTFNIAKAASEDIAVITANQGTSETGESILQYETIQVVVGSVFTFNLKDGEGAKISDVEWSVTKAEGGDKDVPAKTSDISFGTEAQSNVLQVNTIHNDPGIYTITATYGNKTANFILKLYAGATVSGKIQASAGAQETAIGASTELTSDLAVGNVITISIDHYEGDIDYWTAEYEDVEGIHSVPGFSSPLQDKTNAVWTVNALDIQNIPTNAYVTFKAYKPNSDRPIATFMFETKVHMLSNIEGWSRWKTNWLAFPWFFSNPKKSELGDVALPKQGVGNSGTRGKIDGSSSYTYITPTFIADTIHDYFTVTDNATETKFTLNESAVGKSFQVKIKFTVTVPNSTGVKILVYSTVDFLNIQA